MHPLEVVARDGIEPSTRGFSRQLTSQFGASKPKKRDEFFRGRPNWLRRPNPCRAPVGPDRAGPVARPCESWGYAYRDRAGTEQSCQIASGPAQTKTTGGESSSLTGSHLYARLSRLRFSARTPSWLSMGPSESARGNDRTRSPLLPRNESVAALSLHFGAAARNLDRLKIHSHMAT